MRTNTRKLRVGIYAGAFDPVHAGHVSFALQAMEAASLDQVIFMPERRPRHKPGVEHYGHRVAMLKAALAPHPDFAVMEVVDRHFTVGRILPLLKSLYPHAELIFLMGSDAALTIPSWPHADRLLHDCELVIGVRSEHQQPGVERNISAWDKVPPTIMMFESFDPDISSSHIRRALRRNEGAKGLLASVRRYARQEWLYVSPGTV